MLKITTELGCISLRLRGDVAPRTVDHVTRLVATGVLNGCSFYRSDFVVQMGLHGTSRSSPLPNLAVNESKAPGALSNTRGAMAVAHWDVPDCGNSEFFISLQQNAHLDSAYGGYCVFAQVEAHDAESWTVIEKIARSIPAGKNVKIASAVVA